MIDMTSFVNMDSTINVSILYKLDCVLLILHSTITGTVNVLKFTPEHNSCLHCRNWFYTSVIYTSGIEFLKRMVYTFNDTPLF